MHRDAKTTQLRYMCSRKYWRFDSFKGSFVVAFLCCSLHYVFLLPPQFLPTPLPRRVSSALNVAICLVSWDRLTAVHVFLSAHQ